MFSFSHLSKEFNTKFSVNHFPNEPKNLYSPCDYFLSIGGKRVRPVMCLMGCNLFGEISNDAWHVANAVEIFHNFTLIHDDIMDAASLRRGMQTVHTKYNNNVAILAGDVMMIRSYEEINKIDVHLLHKILTLFNKTAKEVCEGQQLDMDFEKQDNVSLDSYIEMINLKTSVLLAASLEMGGILGGTSEGNCKHLYEFGRNLGIAFQIQDDYLDAFGDPLKFGKEQGGDIKQNKKTFLYIHALEVANQNQLAEITHLIKDNPSNKVEKMLQIFKDCGVDVWANELKEKYFKIAMQHLDDIAVTNSRKAPLKELAEFLIVREN